MNQTGLELINDVRRDGDSVLLFPVAVGFVATDAMIPADFTAGDDVVPQGVVQGQGGRQKLLVIAAADSVERSGVRVQVINASVGAELLRDGIRSIPARA